MDQKFYLNKAVRVEVDRYCGKNGMTLELIASRSGMSNTNFSNKVTWTKHSRVLGEDEAEEILVKGLDMRPSEAKDLIAQWKVEEALRNANSPEKVINQVVKDISIQGENNSISQVAK